MFIGATRSGVIASFSARLGSLNYRADLDHVGLRDVARRGISRVSFIRYVGSLSSIV